MASTAAGTRLTGQQRRAQLAVRATALREVVALWPLLDPQRIDETAAAWLRATVEVVARHRVDAAGQAALYFQAFKAAETGQLTALAAATTEAAAAVDRQALARSLAITGPVRLKAAIGRGAPLGQATRAALTSVSGAAGRHVLNGGRELLEVAAETDPDAAGLLRVTADDPCAFCAMQAARGVSRRGQQRWHDGCGCTAEPAFGSGRDSWPERVRDFDQLYTEATAGHSGRGTREAFNAFRRAYERG